MLTEAKRRGLGIVTEFYILLGAERILADERRAFAAWESPQPDLNLIRREFPQERELALRTDFAVCPSDAVRRDLQDNFCFPPGRSAVVPYGVDAKWLELPSQPKAGRVLFVGTAGLRKGIHYLALAADRLRAQGRNYEFRIAGDVTQGIADQPVCRHLTFLGRVPRHHLLQQEYASADVFVLPSLAEGSAESVYEALASGIPVITTCAAGSVVRDQIEGRIVPERDSTALAMAIEQLIENRQSRTTMAAAARERARGYTLERYGARLETALRSFEK
jgi:glycosyltransferase involved in cell wall biosynthesis